MKFLLLLLPVLFLATCNANNKDWLKKNAPAKWEKQGFTVVDYEGYIWGFSVGWSNYGGAHVWHRLKREGSPLLYSGYTVRWGDEIHVYGPTPNEGNIVMGISQ